MAIVVNHEKNEAYNTALFKMINVSECSDLIIEDIGLFNVNLIDSEEGYITIFKAPKKMALEIMDLITNFWFSERKVPLPEQPKMTIKTIEENFDEIVRGDHESGEFALFKLKEYNGIMAAILIASEDGELDEFSEQWVFKGLHQDRNKNELIETIKPFLNPDIFEDFNQYINDGIDLNALKNRMESTLNT